MKKENDQIKSTVHSKYRYQYHIVFAPKYKRKRNIRNFEERHERDIEKTMRPKKSRDHRGRSMPGSRPYAVKFPATFEYITIYGISQGEK